MTKPELLAPAGSWEAFLAGLEAGADAFYLGLKDWSARGRAKNFTLDDLRRLVPLAHAQGRRVYAALNTLVTEEEVPRALDALWELGCLGIDAVILQDLGLWAACREAYPELRLHGSTQLSVHSSAGARQLERMGFSRVVLARECTVPEIGAIQKATALPLEVFVHGALCYSVSGQCLASSALTGRSANRGWCAQVCRWGFRKPGDDPESHPFSPSDLSLVGRVWDLAEAGVSALKIEGRLKGADYVHAVVRAYRKVLDAPPTDRAGALGAALEILKSAATRPATEGYAYHPRPVEVLKRGGRPGVGADVGRVHRWKDGSLTIAATQDLKRGDRIRIQSGPKGEGVALVLRSFHREKVPGGARVSLECPQRVNRGDRVYRVKDARGEELEQRLARELKSLPAETGLPVRLRVAVDGAEVRVAAWCGPAAAEVRHAVPQFPAERRPLDYTTLKKHLGRLGETPYRLEGFAVEGELPPVVIPPSALKEVRNAVVDALDRARVAEAARRRDRAAGRSGAGAGGGQAAVDPGGITPGAVDRGGAAVPPAGGGHDPRLPAGPGPAGRDPGGAGQGGLGAAGVDPRGRPPPLPRAAPGPGRRGVPGGGGHQPGPPGPGGGARAHPPRRLAAPRAQRLGRGRAPGAGVPHLLPQPRGGPGRARRPGRRGLAPAPGGVRLRQPAAVSHPARSRRHLARGRARRDRGGGGATLERGAPAPGPGFGPGVRARAALLVPAHRRAPGPGGDRLPLRPGRPGLRREGGRPGPGEVPGRARAREHRRAELAPGSALTPLPPPAQRRRP
ncbi:MAG: peptidase U32 family protein [Deferrisomatales bacterium]